MAKTTSTLKKYRNLILNILVSIICLVIIYESIFVEVRYWRAVIFGLLLINSIVDMNGFWRNSQKSDK